MGVKVSFELVDGRLLRNLRKYPDELVLHMSDALREISREGSNKAKALAPYRTGELRNSISPMPPRLGGQGNNVVAGGVQATAEHALEMHEFVEPAGYLQPNREGLGLGGGPEGPVGGWFFKRVFEFPNNLFAFEAIMDKYKRQSFNTLD